MIYSCHVCHCVTTELKVVTLPESNLRRSRLSFVPAGARNFQEHVTPLVTSELLPEKRM